MSKLSIITIFLLGPLIFWGNLSNQKIIIGFVQENHFMPLTIIDNDSLYSAPLGTKLEGKIIKIVSKEKEVHSIKSSGQYTDIYTDELHDFAVIDTSISSRDAFYVMSKKVFHFKLPDACMDLIHNFYTFFSKDDWGHHFIGQELLKESTHDIAEKSGVMIHFITDLDSDNFMELWISYKLMYGEIGYMVYEQDLASNDWISIANCCVNCD